jgi:pimeloyl-ACP methyl ester carboxylesterase
MPASSPDSTAPVLILIHGATGNGRMWAPVQRHLDAGIRVITPDLPGHGARRSERFTMEAAVATIAAAAASVAPAPVVLAGDSLGGFTSMASAAALPRDQLKGLVLSGCTMNFEGMAMLPYWLRIAMFRLVFAFYGEQRFIRNKMPKALAELGIDAQDIGPIVEGGISLRVFEQAVTALRGVDYRAKLAAIEQPVLIVNGGKDRDMIAQEASFVAAARRATRHRFDDAGHGVSMLRSAEFAALVNQFVASLVAPASRAAGEAPVAAAA